MKSWIVLLFVGLFSIGCSSSQSARRESPIASLITDSVIKSSDDKYALVIEGGSFKYTGTCRFVESREIINHCEFLSDSFIAQDSNSISNLLISKGYNTLIIKASIDSAVKLTHSFLKQLAPLSTPQTKLFIAYSGHGNEHGLKTSVVDVYGTTLSLPETCLQPKELFQDLNKISGTKCLLLDACESGCFVEEAKKANFTGVIIAACPSGYSTTPCESSGNSALFTGFLNLYEDSTTIHDLSQVNFSAGQWWCNFRHKWSDFWNPEGKPISYDPVFYSTKKFEF